MPNSSCNHLKKRRLMSVCSAVAPSLVLLIHVKYCGIEGVFSVMVQWRGAQASAAGGVPVGESGAA